MKNKTNYLLIILLFAIIQCSSHNKQSDKCAINNEKSARCEVDYYIYNNVIYLDSALYYINEVFDECGEYYSLLLGMRKINIYSLKHEYENAIKFSDTLCKKDIISESYKKIINNRFKAMEAQGLEDTIKRNLYIEKAFYEVNQLFLSREDEFYNFLQKPYPTKYDESIIPIQYYYYKSQIEGMEKVCSELDSLQKAINGDEKYFEMIKIMLEEDFMRFMGI
jgi:hypothetical protein